MIKNVYKMTNLQNLRTYRKILYFCIILMMINGIAAGADRDVIVGFKKPVDQSDDDFIHGHGGKVKKDFHIINAISAKIPEENIETMKKDPRIAYIEEEKKYNVTDEYTNSWGVQHINSKPVHDQNIAGAGVNVTILDTGIITNHEDLINNYKGGYDFVNNDPDPWDDNCLTQLKTCHGTHVAGIVAAENNGIGVVGVAPSANLYAVKVLHASGSGDTSWIISGLQWAADNHMNVAQMSFGGPDSQALHDAIISAYNSGVLLVASAGNTYGGAVEYPAAYTDSVIAVSATGSTDQIASSSAIGPEIELAAPGVNIYSTVEGGYGYLSGTSMAAPHVSGVAALIYSTNFNDANGDGAYDNKDVRLLLHNAKDLGITGRDNTFGYGLVDAQMAVFGVPEPTIIELTLKRVSKDPTKDAQKVDLLQEDYSVDIHNINLSKVTMKVYKDGIYQKRLSKEFKFSKKRNDINFDLMLDGASEVIFIPYGKIGSIGYVTIKKQV